MASRDHGPDRRGAPGPDTQHRTVDQTSTAAEAARRQPEDPPIRNPGQYSLTDHGESLETVIYAMRDWGRQHLTKDGSASA